MKHILLKVKDSWAALCNQCNKPNKDGDVLVVCTRGCHMWHHEGACATAHEASHSTRALNSPTHQ